MITTILQEAAGLSHDKARRWAGPVREAATYADLWRVERLAMFLAQTAHESAGFTRLQENLNYSVAGLMATWPRRFPTKASAEPYARKPEKIANKVYANRMGNGPEASGDGWRYRGRGPIQATGKDNYLAFFRATGIDVVSDPDLMLQPRVGMLFAAWFWKRNKLNALGGDVVAVTRKINGGTHGLDDRRIRYDRKVAVVGQVFARALNVIAEVPRLEPTPARPIPRLTIERQA